jgi:hypothetical protein
MNKRTDDKGRQGQPSPPRRENPASAARTAEGPGQRAAAPDTRVKSPQAVKAAHLAHEQIATRAYRLWESQGKPAGTDWENWFEAERQLQAEAR